MARRSLSTVLDSDVPLYHQIYLHLRAEMLDGSWVGRDDFPGEVELAKRFGVSVITSRKALDRLTEDGFIERSRGRRTRVLRGPEDRRKHAPPAVFQTQVGEQRPFDYKVLSKGLAVAPKEACDAFGLPAGSQLWLCSRLRKYQGHVHSVTLNAQLPDIGKNHSAADLQRLPMTQLLGIQGIRFSRLERRISAAQPSPSVAAQLKLEINEPTLVYSFVHWDVKGAVAQWVRIWVRYDEPSPEEVFSYETGTWSMSSSM